MQSEDLTSGVSLHRWEASEYMWIDLCGQWRWLGDEIR